MKKPVAGRGMLSRLPERQEYWDELTDRIVSDALPDLGSRREQRAEWWSAMGRFSTVLAGAAAAAVIAAISLLPTPAAPIEPVAVRVAVPVAVPGDAFGIAPDHPLATQLMSADAPPRMEVIVVSAMESGR